MTHGGKGIIEDGSMQNHAIALSTVRLHRLGIGMVQSALKEPVAEVIRLNEIKKVLTDIFLFKTLEERHIDNVVRSLEKKKYAAGDVIVQQGDEATHFFLIQAGTLGKWDYFGERGLLMQDKRSATCQAEDTVVCLILEAKAFADIVGKFRKELEHRMQLQDLDVKMEDLRLKAVVGQGSFGTVKLVYHKDDTKKCYALKCVIKKQVVRQGQERSMQIEREINAQCYHPCIMQFIKTFQDAKSVYFLTEFLGGGDLFFAIREIGNLTKEQSQYFSASIVLALEYLHARGIMYRDLKPENVLLNFEGHCKLVDFGCCKKALRTSTLVGTPEYFAPEVIIGKGYTCSIDWWSLGVMMHEFIVGPLPFGRNSEDQLELFREILEAPLSFPNFITDETGISIISGLLERVPELRLGASTRQAKEIKEHRYYQNYPWDAVAGRYMTPPWTPDTVKLQENWEDEEGKEVFDMDGPDDEDVPGSFHTNSTPSSKPSFKTEKGMEWAINF
eukprot:gnl/TRDRNA2_/TRDRNA2_174159_c1_seq1.p1 gnl/TRDRNA2_/TRDRNA2_174159_c1~~gnl/TRDRNA2_/TRDRNA2_174159_c1_seq1.p1  ORF type:complete len:502 (+),score=119.07 gnl/TRDRNA2_/TRDRNA2_174159_c1_seq1:1361-2866(+)